MCGGMVSTSPALTTISLPSIQNFSAPSRMYVTCSLWWLCSGTTHPFFIRTRATIMSWPTIICRCSNGFRSSSSTVFHGIYFSSFFAAFLPIAFFFVVLGFGADFFSILVLALFALAILVNLSVINCYGIVVQITMRQLERLRLSNFALGNHLGKCTSQGRPRGLYP